MNLCFARKEWPHQAQHVLYNVWLLSSELAPNLVQTRTLSVLPGSVKGLTAEPGSVKTSSLRLPKEKKY